MSRRRSRGLFNRFRNLTQGFVSGWLRDTEGDNPRVVYEQAIEERKHQYRELKEAVAGILYMRNKLEGEITERRAEIARLYDDVRRAVRHGSDDLSVALISKKQMLMEDLERAEAELDTVRCEAEEAKNNLVRFREEIRSLVQEKGRMLATLANAQARRRISEAIDGLSVDANMQALENVRENIARIATEGTLEREVGDVGLRTRIRAIRGEVRDEAARLELSELKKQLDPGHEATDPALEAVTHRAEASVPATG